MIHTNIFLCCNTEEAKQTLTLLFQNAEFTTERILSAAARLAWGTCNAIVGAMGQSIAANGMVPPLIMIY